MHSMKKIQLIAISVIGVLVLNACQKNTLGEAKTLEYYSKNIPEAETVISKCDDLEKKELSVMAPQQRVEWEGTSDGINCRNARDASQQHKWAEYQRQMREAAAKYSK